MASSRRRGASCSRSLWRAACCLFLSNSYHASALGLLRPPIVNIGGSCFARIGDFAHRERDAHATIVRASDGDGGGAGDFDILDEWLASPRGDGRERERKCTADSRPRGSSPVSRGDGRARLRSAAPPARGSTSGDDDGRRTAFNSDRAVSTRFGGGGDGSDSGSNRQRRRREQQKQKSSSSKSFSSSSGGRRRSVSSATAAAAPFSSSYGATASGGTGRRGGNGNSGYRPRQKNSEAANSPEEEAMEEADDDDDAAAEDFGIIHRYFEDFDPSVLPQEEKNVWEGMREMAGTPAAVEALRKVVAALPGGLVPPRLFQQLFSFPLDGFQLEALAALAGRRSVVVSAPTGSGKTVAGELAIYYALALGLRVFYTTPLKALSNQKFSDFRAQFGAARVGLLTGDSSLNRDAQVCVMTTEVFRNMLYDGERRGVAAEYELKDVFAVVFDEAHYMNDRDRGTVWEESIISCPRHILLVALSATMGNVGEVRDWINETHGAADLVTSDFRPVPLRYWYANRHGLFPLFRDLDSGPGAPRGGMMEEQRRRAGLDPEAAAAEDMAAETAERNGNDDGKNNKGGFVPTVKPGASRRRRKRLPERLKINEQLLEMHDEEQEQLRRLGPAPGAYERNSNNRVGGGGGGGGGGGRDSARRGGGGGGGGGRRGGDRGARDIVARQVPSFPYLVRALRRRELLPAIVFIFSRTGCDRAAADVGLDYARAAARDAEDDDGYSSRNGNNGGGGANGGSIFTGGLLSEEEAGEVARRLDAFRAANAQIPVLQNRVALLLQGLATHHAGLLPVYKAFIEELFAANLLKVVFATETLAAGVNMPARTTVITSLSKRGDTGIVKLEPSQLLQMAGRAGRRGKDTQGGVVIMRSRYEDVIEAHRLLLSPLNPIESKFRSSYSMAANILRTRGMAAARTIVEKSFGTFLNERKRGSDPLAQRAEEATERLAALETVLGGTSLGEAKQYRKLWERQRGEERILSYLLQQETDVEREVVQTVLPLSRLGSALRLRTSGATAVLLGDYDVPGASSNERGDGVDRVVALTLAGEVLAIPYDEVRFVDVSPDAGIPVAEAADLAAAVAPRLPWLPAPPLALEIDAGMSIAAAAAAAATEPAGALSEKKGKDVPKPLLEPTAAERSAWGGEMVLRLREAAVSAAASTASSVTAFLPEEPGHVSRQRAVLGRVRAQVEEHAVHERAEAEGVLRLGKDIVALEDAVRQGWKNEQKAQRQPAWEEFLAVCRVLQRYGALEGDLEAEVLAAEAKAATGARTAAVAAAGEKGAPAAATGAAAATTMGPKARAAAAKELFAAAAAAATAAAAVEPAGIAAAAAAAASSQPDAGAAAAAAATGAAAAAAAAGDSGESIPVPEAATALPAAAAAATAIAAGEDSPPPQPAAAAAGAVEQRRQLLQPTAFGDLVGAVNAENELWLALVLTSTAVKSLAPEALAGLMPAIVGEYSRPDMFVAYGASPAVLECIAELAPLAQELLEAQFLENVDFPVRLDGALCGLVEGWAGGCDWAELVGSTTLDQGDICRLLRRSMELLRQIPVLPGIPALLKDRARAAAELLDRFPVSDETSTNYLVAADETAAETEKASVVKAATATAALAAGAADGEVSDDAEEEEDELKAEAFVTDGGELFVAEETETEAGAAAAAASG